MKSGQCPKCGSEEIYSNKRVGDFPKRQSGPLFSVWGRKRAVDTYVCDVCGYVEYYFPQGAELDSIRSSGSRQRPPNKD